MRIIKPQGAAGTMPVIVYMHGGGWILGNAATHDRLVRELAVGARAALVFVEYPNSPEAHYPVAIEQGYATAQWITRDGASKGLDASRMAVAGESVGGNMTAALALMAKERGDVTFVQQSMYYPVTDAAMNTASYEQFATGYYLSRKEMEWFWDAYTTDPKQRAEITASPNQASLEQVTGLPLHAARRTQGDPRRARRGRPGHRLPARRARNRLSGPALPQATTMGQTRRFARIPGYSRLREIARDGTANDRRKTGRMFFPLHRKAMTWPSSASKVAVRLEFRPLRIFRV